MKGAQARGEHEDPCGEADLATLLRQIGSLDETELGDAVTKLLDSPDVTDTLDELRRHIDDLFHRLDAEPAAPAAPAEPRDQADLSPEFEAHVEALGRKMDGASGLLAELTDVLESQTERIETIEQQLGDPDYAYAVEPTDPARTPAAVTSPRPEPNEIEDAVEAPDPTDVLRELLNDRLDRVESRISDMEARITDLRTLALQRDRHVRELEERLVVSVEAPAASVSADVPRFGASPQAGARPAPAEASVEAFVAAPGVGASAAVAGQGSALEGASPEPTYAPVYPPVREPAPESLPEPDPESTRSPSPAEGNLGPARGPAGERGQAPTEARLAELVEREVRSQRDFGAGAISKPGGEHPTVMVVDDSADARTILSIYLSKTGYNVVTAASAEDCLAKLRHHAVDAVVLDARMPGADGGHVCRMLREDRTFARWRELPIIVYTAYPDECSRAVADGWGATDYVVKGGDMLPLITSLVRHTKIALGASS